MKFIAEPNLVITDSTSNKFLLKFDDKGEFETEDPKLIKRLMPRFEHVESGLTPPEHTCKKCGKSFDRKGQYIAHFRTDCKGGD